MHGRRQGGCIAASPSTASISRQSTGSLPAVHLPAHLASCTISNCPLILSLPAQMRRSCSVLVRLRLEAPGKGRTGRMDDVVAGDLRMHVSSHCFSVFLSRTSDGASSRDPSVPCWIHGSRHTNLAHGGIPMTGECDAIRLTRDTHAYSMPIRLSLLSVQASSPFIPYKSWVSWSAPTSPRPVVSSHSQITYHEPTTHARLSGDSALSPRIRFFSYPRTSCISFLS